MKKLVLCFLVLALALTATVSTTVEVASASEGNPGISGCAIADLGDLDCNTLNVSSGGTLARYGSYGFSDPWGNFEESFCIEYGIAGGSPASAVNSELRYTGLAGALGAPLTLHHKGIPWEWGTDGDDANAKYIISWILERYFTGALDGEVTPYRISFNSNVYIVHKQPFVSDDHVLLASAISYIVHMWYDIGTSMNSLRNFVNFMPYNLKALAQHLVDIVPDTSVTFDGAHIVYSGGQSYVAIPQPAYKQYSISGVSFWHNNNYIVAPYTRGTTISVCQTLSTLVLYHISHTGAKPQDNLHIGQQQYQAFCAPLSIDDGFRLNITGSQMLQMRYVTGNIADRVDFAYSGNWPCDLSDLGSPAGSCQVPATFTANSQLFQKLTPADTSGTPSGSVASHTLVRPNSPANSWSLEFNFGARSPGFYTAQTSVVFTPNAGAGQVIHPQNLANLDETVSTYKCDLLHSSHVDNYSIVVGQGQHDEITISGRCSSLSGNLRAGERGLTNSEANSRPESQTVSNAFVENNTAELLLIGPLTSTPGRNASNERPKYECRVHNIANTDCIYAQKTITLQNGTLGWGSFGEQLTPEIEGIYTIVYHFPGDVFTPEFWSDASDGEEMFSVEGEHLQMWSSATPVAEIGQEIHDTVYIAGNVRAGASLEFTAYRAQDPDRSKASPRCDFSAEIISQSTTPVNAHGGKYVSPNVISPEIGNVYWVARLLDADGTLYNDYYNGQTIPMIGICGEESETSSIVWNIALSSDAKSSAKLGAKINDTAHIDLQGINANAINIPQNISVSFKAYRNSGYAVPTDFPVFTSTMPLSDCAITSSTSLDCNSPSFTPVVADSYFWVVSVIDQFGNTLAEGKYSDPREISYVTEISSDVSTHYLQSGDKISDTFHILGTAKPGARLKPTLIAVSTGEVVPGSDVIQLTPNQSHYTTNSLPVFEPGDYYFSYELYDSENATEPYDIGVPNDPRESFSVVDLTTNVSAKSIYIGEEFTDTATLLGNYPADICVKYDLYYQHSGTDTRLDKLVDTTECMGLTAENYESMQMTSQSFTRTMPGKYYFVATVYSKDGKILATGEKRDERETIELRPLNGTIYTYSETPERVYLGEKFNDRVNVSGRITDDAWIIWDIYKQDMSSDDPIDDKLVKTTKKKMLSENIYEVPENGMTQNQLTWINSDDISFDEVGTYYWVERVYSPLQTAPIAVGLPRVPSETVEVRPHTGVLSTMSRAVNFVREGEEFNDKVYLKCNDLTYCQDMHFKGWTILWKVYRKDLHTDDISRDTLIYQSPELPLSTGKVTNIALIEQNADDKNSAEDISPELEIASPSIRVTNAGIYYWVEEIHSPLQNEPVAIQDARNLQETTIVETATGKYVRVGARRNATQLATTGLNISIGKIAGTAVITGVMAAYLRTKKRRKKCKNQRNIWWGHSYWLH